LEIPGEREKGRGGGERESIWLSKRQPSSLERKKEGKGGLATAFNGGGLGAVLDQKQEKGRGNLAAMIEKRVDFGTGGEKNKGGEVLASLAPCSSRKKRKEGK